MSAAAPPPPPPHRILPTSDGGNSSYGGATDEPANSQRPRTDGVADSRTKSKAIPHIDDLVALAEHEVDPRAPLVRLLERASDAIQQARSYLEFRGGPQHIYYEYSVASYIVRVVVPRHKDAPMLHSQYGKLPGLKSKLDRDLERDAPQFNRIRDLILNDNEESGIQPKSRSRNESRPPSSGLDERDRERVNSPNEQRPSSMYIQPRSDGISQKAASSQRNSLDYFTQRNGHTATDNGQHKPRPPVQPKPQNLHGRVVTSNGQRVQNQGSSIDIDDLSQRWARLKPIQSSHPQDSRPTEETNGFALPPEFGLPPDPGQPAEGWRMWGYRDAGTQKQDSSGKPSSQYGQSKRNITVDPNLAKQLPKEPSPTYSPARTYAPGTAITTDDTVRNGITSNSEGTSSLMSGEAHSYSTNSTSYTIPATTMNNPPVKTYPSEVTRPTLPSSDSQVMRRRRRSTNAQAETEISAQRLYDYLRTFDVLLIDARSREEFDSGHIFSQFGMCIEPVVIRPNMSAEELYESLVLSPEAEQVLFNQRNEFELVVYYDQSTTSRDLQSARGNEKLRYLRDALSDFNQEKPLRWPPILLNGGIDAWTDLLGGHALKMSDTAMRKKAGRPLARRAPASGGARPNLQRRRHREYNALTPEEEQMWRERARSESVTFDTVPFVEEAENETSGESPDSYMRNYEDFHRRFPEVSPVEQSMSSFPPEKPVPQRRPPPHDTSSVPTYPQPPLTSAPTRPPPAVPRPSYSGVTEKASQAVASSRTTQLPRYVPTKMLRLPRTGLVNFGVTCYMNATIQCLSATMPLSYFFCSGDWVKHLQKNNWKGAKGIFAEWYYHLLKNLWDSRPGDLIRPKNFRKFCEALNKEWGLDRQQDAKEFLEFVVDALHEDLNDNWNRSPLRPLTEAEEAERERMPRWHASLTEWERYLHRDHSELQKLFAGQHISRLNCKTCGFQSTTYEPFYSISVEIPQRRSSSAPVSIYDCLRSYCSAETLAGDEVWRCPHCKKEREAVKTITISRAPQFLVIHLKRFSASHSERARKIHTPVEFPLEGLELDPFMLGPPGRGDVPDSKSLPHLPVEMTPPYTYKAYAVMRHLGSTMTSGHYVALCADPGRKCWRQFNDDRVTDFQPHELPPAKRLQNEQAYIVFYQRVMSTEE